MIYEEFNKKSKSRDSGYRVIREIFEDINDLAQYVKKAPTSDLFKGEEPCSSHRESSRGDRGFHDFKNFDEAINALEFGTDIYFEDFKKNIRKVKDFLAKKEINKKVGYKNDVVGFMPIVPNVVIGSPINMINQEIKPKKTPTAKIVLEKGNSASIKASDMSYFYSIVFVLIQLLEQKGIRCEIWVTETSRASHEITCWKTKIKNFNQPINFFKIQFPIIASDFFRRILFRVTETAPLRADWTWGYGHPLLCDDDEFKINKAKGEVGEDLCEVIGLEDGDVFIPSCQWFNIEEGSDIDTAIEKIIRCTALHKYIDLKE